MTRKPARKPLTEAEKADRAAALQTIHDELEAKFASLTSSDDWTKALDFAAKFYRYSFGNTMWLHMQALGRDPEMELAQVASFKAWQALGRNVIKGETALRVLAPMRFKVTDEKTGKEKWIVKGFKAVPVFDVSQTEGDELPDEVAPVLLTEGGELGVMAQVEQLIAAQGFSYELGDAHGANGFTSFEEKRIVVRPDVELAQQIKTAVHELAHALLHGPGQVDYSTNRSRCEVEAESVAYVVLTHLGIDCSSYSIPYVASWASSDVKVVKATAETVIKTARTIIDTLGGVVAEEVAA